MKKQFLFLLLALSLTAIPLWAGIPGNDGEEEQYAQFHAKAIKAKISGSAIPVANPSGGPNAVLANLEGHGNMGRISGQGILIYAPTSFGPDGKAAIDLLEAQASFRLEINGDVLLAVYDPGVVGWMQIIDPSTGYIVWEQSCTGRIVGGTGALAGKTGTFKKSFKGFALYFTAPGVPANVRIQPWSGVLEIHFDE